MAIRLGYTQKLSRDSPVKGLECHSAFELEPVDNEGASKFGP